MGERMLKFFAYEHLRADLQGVSIPFFELAHRIVEDPLILSTPS